MTAAFCRSELARDEPVELLAIPGHRLQAGSYKGNGAHSPPLPASTIVLTAGKMRARRANILNFVLVM
jgi:hypothetical protein